MLTPAALAFVGDAAYSLYVRKKLVEKTDLGGGNLHLSASRFCNARAQAEALEALVADDVLTEAEKDVARRAKNAHVHNRTKAASPADYHSATALEAVIGFAEMTGDTLRRDALMEKCFEIIELAAIAEAEKQK